jgi:predicted amidophosphoribosyltransferase
MKCRLELKPLDFPLCLVCDNLSIKGRTHKYCSRPFYPDSFNASYVYGPLVKKIILKSKSGNASYRLLELLADYPAIKILCTEKNINLVTFIPASKKHKRLVDQGHHLASLITQKTGQPLLDVFLIQRFFEQKKLRRKERISGAKGKYFIPLKYKNRLKGKNVLLVDDICTTGSSLLEAAILLKKNEAQSVHCYTLAKDLKSGVY